MLKEQMQTHHYCRGIVHRFRGAEIQHGNWGYTRCGEKSEGKRKQVGVQNHPKIGSVVRNRRMQTLAEMMLMVAMMIWIAASVIDMPGFMVMLFRVAGTSRGSENMRNRSRIIFCGTRQRATTHISAQQTVHENRNHREVACEVHQHKYFPGILLLVLILIILPQFNCVNRKIHKIRVRGTILKLQKIRAVHEVMGQKEMGTDRNDFEAVLSPVFGIFSARFPYCLVIDKGLLFV